MSETAKVQSACEGSWPDAHGRRLLFLLDACTPLEQQHLERWIRQNEPESAANGEVQAVQVLASRRNGSPARVSSRLESFLATDDDPLLAPIRVAWLAEEKDGERSARPAHLLTLHNPHDPGNLRQRWILRRHPDRCRIVLGEPAPLSELRSRWRKLGGQDSAATTGLAEFVVRQAALALERAERRLRGARYKVPRFVHEEILSRPAFRGGVSRLAWELGKTEAEVSHDAGRDLSEIAATHSTYVIDITAQLIRLLYTRGYGEALHYDRSQLERIYQLAQRYPVVFLPSHRSNLDHLVLQYALHENGHPPNHTAGGINMNFFPVGPLVRRSGVFFIRRSFKDLLVYKYVLRHYIDYLVEKRFPLEWYLEGGRSRSGKLLPPRFGLLAYVADAYRRRRSEDVYLIPVSIAYDQIQDVGDYVAEQRGAAKEVESFGWFLKMLRRFRSRYGDIHIRFGEPLSLHDTLGPPTPTAEPNPDEQNLDVQKLAFEVMVRINRATPITPTSLLTHCMLGQGDRALTVEELTRPLADLVAYVRKRGLPTTTDLSELTESEGIKRTLETLIDHEVVSCFSEGPEAVYMIAAERHLAAAFYRNTIIHFFVNGAIAELALLYSADENVSDRESAFWDEIMRLRDLLKFEFFFSDKDEFREEIRKELCLHSPDWEQAFAGAAADLHKVLRSVRPWNAHRVLRPFLEAYRVVADALERRDPSKPFDEGAFLADCLARGKQYQLQRRIGSPESISKLLFATGLRLARNRRLIEGGDEEFRAKRRAFAEEIRSAIRRVDAIDALAASRRARLIE